jgi:hypothetical protein
VPRKPDVPCADCGVLMWRGSGSLAPGQARCRPCRRARPALGTLRVRRLPSRPRSSECQQRGADGPGGVPISVLHGSLFPAGAERAGVGRGASVVGCSGVRPPTCGAAHGDDRRGGGFAVCAVRWGDGRPGADASGSHGGQGRLSGVRARSVQRGGWCAAGWCGGPDPEGGGGASWLRSRGRARAGRRCLRGGMGGGARPGAWGGRSRGCLRSRRRGWRRSSR